ncbi:MAG: FAD-dependent oxidoreductase [Deltaproteobacteria bacterium]|nr:FAD-dependent oxidoreductase [Deltaproteobacteria bacterium]
MTTSPCPVKRLSKRLSQTLESGQISRRREAANRLLRLADDITFGRGKAGHLSAMESLARELSKERLDTTCAETGQIVISSLQENRSIFLSHIEAHYCLTGECDVLSAAPCRMACPANVDAPSYVALVGMGRYREALEVLWENLPIPGSLGRVCVHPCESACRRGEVDAPIAICRLKRVAFDEAFKEGKAPNKSTTEHFKEKIAIIGSGPAGLSTGYFLVKKGYGPVIFESMPESGGMLRWGIPAYRLPRDILRREIECIKAMGVEMRTGITFGKDITIDGLKEQGYKALFLGIGAWRCMPLPIEGAQDNPGVVDCLTFLRSEHTRQFMVGKRVVVIGGGNAAVDCVRTALRLDVDEVQLVYRRSRREMPAHHEEVEAAEKEGAILTYLSSPVRVHHDNGKTTGLECIRNRLSEPDATGRRRPIPIEGSEYMVPTDTVISAIGQLVEISSFEGEKTPELSKNHLIAVNPETMETSMPGVFAGGDVVTGPSTVVEAVAAGKKAAESIHCYLRGLSPAGLPSMPAGCESVPVMEISPQEKSLDHRPLISEIDLKQRMKGFEEVEIGLSREHATEEAKRCLRCDICISCGRCIEACKDEMGVDAIHLSYVEQHATAHTDFTRPAEKCIGCGACAVNCPTEAITLEDKKGERLIRMCGAEMSRHSLLRCASCEIPFVTQKHLDYIRARADKEARIKYPRNLCPACARKAGAERFAKTITSMSKK